MPLTAFINTPYLWQLAGLYVSNTVVLNDRLKDVKARVSLFCQWQCRETHKNRLFKLIVRVIYAVRMRIKRNSVALTC
jgi:hypothetical protein